jgi:hypothetical protein
VPPLADAEALVAVGRAVRALESLGDSAQPLPELEEVERAVGRPGDDARPLSVARGNQQHRADGLAVGESDGAGQAPHLRVVFERLLWRQAGFEVPHLDDVAEVDDVVSRASKLGVRLPVVAAEVIPEQPRRAGGDVVGVGNLGSRLIETVAHHLEHRFQPRNALRQQVGVARERVAQHLVQVVALHGRLVRLAHLRKHPRGRALVGERELRHRGQPHVHDALASTVRRMS